MGWWSTFLATSTMSFSDRHTSLVSCEPQEGEEAQPMLQGEDLFGWALNINQNTLARAENADCTTVISISSSSSCCGSLQTEKSSLKSPFLRIKPLWCRASSPAILRVGSPSWNDLLIRLRSHLPYHVFHFLDQLQRRFLWDLLGNQVFFLIEEISVIWLSASGSIFGTCSLWLSGIFFRD